MFGLAILLLAAFIYATSAARQTTAIRAEGRNLVRLHVVANSNNPGDQAVKLKVRDRILQEIGAELTSASDARQALDAVGAELGRIQTLAADELARNGYTYGAAATVGAFNFPERTYGSLTLPAGRYNALRVVLGEGRGQNWWCVLFPPLCLVDLAVEVDGPAAATASGTVTVAAAASAVSTDPAGADPAPIVLARGEDAAGRPVALVATAGLRELPFEVKWQVLEWWRKTTLGQVLARVAGMRRQTQEARP